MKTTLDTHDPALFIPENDDDYRTVSEARSRLSRYSPHSHCIAKINTFITERLQSAAASPLLGCLRTLAQCAPSAFRIKHDNFRNRLLTTSNFPLEAAFTFLSDILPTHTFHRLPSCEQLLEALGRRDDYLFIGNRMHTTLSDRTPPYIFSREDNAPEILVVGEYRYIRAKIQHGYAFFAREDQHRKNRCEILSLLGTHMQKALRDDLLSDAHAIAWHISYYRPTFYVRFNGIQHSHYDETRRLLGIARGRPWGEALSLD